MQVRSNLEGMRFEQNEGMNNMAEQMKNYAQSQDAKMDDLMRMVAGALPHGAGAGSMSEVSGRAADNALHSCVEA